MPSLTCVLPTQGKLVVLFRSAMCVVEGKDLVEGVRAGVSGKGEGECV